MGGEGKAQRFLGGTGNSYRICHFTHEKSIILASRMIKLHDFCVVEEAGGSSAAMVVEIYNLNAGSWHLPAQGRWKLGMGVSPLPERIPQRTIFCDAFKTWGGWNGNDSSSQYVGPYRWGVNSLPRTSMQETGVISLCA